MVLQLPLPSASTGVAEWTREVRVAERSTSAIESPLYRQLEASEEFWALVDSGVVSLIQSRAVPHGIRASCYVGEALVDGAVRIVVSEKVPGTLRCLLHWATPEDLRETDVPALGGGGSVLLDSFARRFLHHVGSYLRLGRLKEYRAKRMSGPRPRGRIDVRRSALQRAVGRPSRLVFTHAELTSDLLPNRLLALAVRAIDAYFLLHGESEEILVSARTYAPLFDDVDWYDLSRSGWQEKRAAFATAFEHPGVEGDLRSALSFAQPIVLHLGPWPLGRVDSVIPASYFLNLETLFEDATRRVLGELRPGVMKGAQLVRPLFRALEDRYIADPDITVSTGSRVEMVMDCKFKVLEEYPEHADVYQLVAHCSALSATRGALVYPSSRSTISVLGSTEAGIRVSYCGVRVEHLKEDLDGVLAHLAAP